MKYVTNMSLISEILINEKHYFITTYDNKILPT